MEAKLQVVKGKYFGKGGIINGRIFHRRNKISYE